MAIGAVSGWIGWNTGLLAYGAAGGEGFGALMAGGIVGGATGGATGGGLSAAANGGNIGTGILQGAGLGAIAGGVTAGLIYAGVPNALAAAGGGYASGYAQCGSECGGEGALYSFGGAVLNNALTIAGVGADGTVPAEGSSEWQAMHAKNNTYVTTPGFHGVDDILWNFIALIGSGHSHTWHSQDTQYVPEGSYYKLVQNNVPYPAGAEAYNHKNGNIFTSRTGFNLFNNNCTTRFGYRHPAQYSAYYNYPGQGAYRWGW